MNQYNGLTRVEVAEITAIFDKHKAVNDAFFAEVRAAQKALRTREMDDHEDEWANAPLVSFLFGHALPRNMEQFGRIADALAPKR